MKDEYIIINRTAILKRIEEMEKQKDEYSFNPNRTEDYYRYISMIKVLKEILSQSTPLIPEIEEAFEAGENNMDNDGCHIDINGKQDYISNLKLDI